MLSQWLKSGGRSGACPDWYALLVSAETMGVPPWLLTGESPPAVLYWRDRALHKRRIDNDAAAWHRDHPGWA